MNLQQQFKQYLNQYQLVKATKDTHGWSGWYAANGCDTKRVFPPKDKKSNRAYVEKMVAKLNADLEAAE